MIHSSTLGTLVLALLFAEVTAEQSLYAQCGGINWTGGTVCWPGSTCTKHNDWYYQCLPGTTTPTSTSRPIATTTTTALIVTTSSGRSIPTGNPFVGKEMHVELAYANEGYKEKVKAEYDALVSKRNTDLAAKVAKLINVPVAIWAVDRASVASIGLYLRDASEVQTRTGKKQIVPLVVYNLPDRDCAGGASAGEFYSASSGEVKYREFIAAVKSQIQANANVAVAMILEPDSVGNIVTNQAIPFCATAAQVHRRGLAYAISVLGALPNVYLYLDGAHATWLGWPDELGRTASVLGSIYTAAKQLNPKAVVRGISTDVSNYNGLEAEKTYHSDLKPYLDKVGYPAHFVVDQSRSGNQNKTRSGEGWCNYKYAGIGERPTAMNSTLLDAILWVKPPGESDGTSDPNSTRYNPVCASNTSYVPSPEAGQWGSGVFRSMVQYANPPL